jgi:F0F1-type ATP synthase membrane subunit b/b'
MDPEFTIVLSFTGFCWIFAKKIYPPLIGYLDSYIEEVKKQISYAETYKDEASVTLERSRVKKTEVQTALAEFRLRNEKKLDVLRKENEKMLQNMRKKYEASAESRLSAELAMQKNLLIKKVATTLVKKLKQEARSQTHHIETNIKKEDLEKLLL